MANWDIITAFNAEASNWLNGENLPHPSPTFSRMPTTKQITDGWRFFDTSKSVLIDGFDWDNPNYTPEDGFQMRGDRVTELRILKAICKHCGQLWMYPDTGEPAIIVDETIDPEAVDSLHEQCNQHEDSWERFYRAQHTTKQTSGKAQPPDV